MIDQILAAAPETSVLVASIVPSTNAGIRSVLAEGWVATPVTVGANPVRSQEPGRCVDVPNRSQANETAVSLWDCNGGANQTWVRTH